MTRLVAVALLLVSLAVQAPATVSGVVTDATTNAPVAGARVLLARVDGPIGQSVAARTDDQGRFALAGVPAGSYRAFAVDPLYLRREATQPIVVRDGTSTPELSIAMVRTGVIAGRVYTEHGDPAPGVYVRVWEEDAMVGETQTNDLGEYRVFGLEPGRYVVSAERYLAPRVEGNFLITPTRACPDCPGEGAARQSVANVLRTGGFVDPRAVAGRGPVPVFFPAARTRQQATPIEVTPGAEIAGIDLRLVR